MKRIWCILLLLFSTTMINAQKTQDYQLSSPNKKIQVAVQAGEVLRWSINLGDQPIIVPSTIAMILQGGETLGANIRVSSAKSESINTQIKAINYKKSTIEDNYNQLTINFRGNYGVIFRAYNDGVAYRFFTNKKNRITVQAEVAEFNFAKDHLIYIPYVNNPHRGDMFQTSFENTYNHIRISEINSDTLAFTPVLVELDHQVKVAITEADLEDYAGMFLKLNRGKHSLIGEFATYPIAEEQGGHNNLQSFVTERTDFIANTMGNRVFPWRMVIISENDKELLNNDMVYKLASPSRIQDVSWIEPGKVAWDWWNDWNISGVDFRAGINTATYKYYIDFASEFGIENVLLDEGWATSEDIMKIVPEINLQEIIDYAKQKNVGIWLWGGWLPLDKQTDEAFSTYSKMGIKGFKVDFMDRDDQKMVNFYYRISKKAAENKLMLDFHGAYKPTGLQRTYPNVMTFEGVQGLEYAKWSNPDFPTYDATIPFIRQLAGPIDYTPGAMKNANKWNFRYIHSSPMSQGTRCHQLAMYVLYESPFAMLADNPTNYKREAESARFIASIPTVFDETVALGGEVSKYAAIARRKDNNWYIGALTNWDKRDIIIDLSFLPEGNFEAEIFKDGMNADRDGTDYVREVVLVTAKDRLKVQMSAGGGWAARILLISN